MFPIYQSLYKHLPPSMLFPHYQSMGKLEAPPPARLATSAAAAHSMAVDTNIFAAAAMAAMEASKQVGGDHPDHHQGPNHHHVKFERSESISPTPSKSPIVVGASEVSAAAASKPFLKFSVNAILAQNKAGSEEVGEDEDDAVNSSSDLKGRRQEYSCSLEHSQVLPEPARDLLWSPTIHHN